MNKTNNALEIAFKQAVLDKTKTKKGEINTALFKKKQSNTIQLPDKANESQKTERDEQAGAGNHVNGVVRRTKTARV